MAGIHEIAASIHPRQGQHRFRSFPPIDPFEDDFPNLGLINEGSIGPFQHRFPLETRARRLLRLRIHSAHRNGTLGPNGHPVSNRSSESNGTPGPNGQPSTNGSSGSNGAPGPNIHPSSNRSSGSNGQVRLLRSAEFAKYQKTDFTHKRTRDLRKTPPGSHYSVHGDHGVKVMNYDSYAIITTDEPIETTWAINAGVGLRMPDAEGRSVWDIQGHMQHLVDNRHNITPGHDYLEIHKPGIDFIFVPRLQNPWEEKSAKGENEKAFAQILYSNALAMKATGRDDIMVVPTYWVPMTRSHNVLIEMDDAFHKFAEDKNRVIGPNGETIGEMYRDLPLRIPKASPLTETAHANIHAHNIIQRHNEARSERGYKDFLDYDLNYRGNSDLSLAKKKNGGAGGPIASLLTMRYGMNLAAAANRDRRIHTSLALGVGSRGGLVVPTAEQIALNEFPDAGLNFQSGFMTGSPFQETLDAIDLIEGRNLSEGAAPKVLSKRDVTKLHKIIRKLAAQDTLIKDELLRVVIPMADAKLGSDKRQRKSHTEYGRGNGGVASSSGTATTRPIHYLEPDNEKPGPRAIGDQNIKLDGLGIAPAVATLGALDDGEFKFVDEFLGGHLTKVLPYFAQFHDPDISRFDNNENLRGVREAVQLVNSGYERLGQHADITPNEEHIRLTRAHQELWFRETPPVEADLAELRNIKNQLGELRGFGG